MRRILALAAFCGFFVTAAPLAAQAWDAPMFLPPHPGEDLGVYVTKPNHRDWGLEGIWRQQGNLNLGVRAGISGISGETSWLVGAEAYGDLLRPPSSPVDVDWVLGAGATFQGDFSWLRIPFGVSIGRTLVSESMTITPYVLPRIVLDVRSASNTTDTELNFAADIGADFTFTPGWKLRAAATLGPSEVNSFGVGIAFDFGRKVEVR